MVEDGHPQVLHESSRKHAQPGYYLAREAAEKLGIARSTFYSSYVEPGLIPRDIPEEGRSEGQYLAELIDALVPVFERRASLTRRQLRQEITAVRDRVIRRKPVAATDWTREEDLPFVEYLDLQVYGPMNTVPMAITWEWWQRNPRMCRILYNTKDRRDIWGELMMMPLREEIIFRLLRHEMEKRDIRPQDILPYEEGHDYSCYVASLMVKPEHRVHLRMLLQNVFDYWCEQYPQIKISRLYADVTSESGMHAIHHLFFSPRYDLGETIFELRPLRAGNPSSLVSQFQRCLQQKGETPTP